MKIILVLGLILGFSFDGFSQNKSIKDTNCIDVMPEFIGGNDSLNRYLNKNLNYPEKLLEKGIRGTVNIDFIVNEDGSISDIKVVKGVHKLLDQEAIRLIKKMPKWKSGSICGSKLKLYQSLPISFVVEE